MIQYDSSKIPAEIMCAAEKVAEWAITNGLKDWRIGPVADRQLVEEKTELPKEIKPGSFWLVVYEHRPTVIKIAPDRSGFFALGQDELWPLLAINAWIREIHVVP